MIPTEGADGRRSLTTFAAPARASFMASSTVHQDARDGGGHEGGERAGQQGPESEPRDVALARGGQAADPTDLDSDRRKIGKPAQREGCDEPSLLGGEDHP